VIVGRLNSLNLIQVSIGTQRHKESKESQVQVTGPAFTRPLEKDFV
jgi:hypothetical protein